MKKVILISFLCSLILGFIQACSESDEDSPLITLNTALTVVSISPPDGTVGVDVTTDVSVTFSKSMNTSSITTNTADTSCSGSFQLSSDGFSTCEKMSASPTASAEDKTFLVSPASGLANSATYVVRITTSAKDSAGGTLADQYTAATGFTTVAASPTKIYLFQGSDSTVAGDLGNGGGRTGADAICAASTHKPVGVTFSINRAFLSIDATDTIKEMTNNYGFPSNLPIVSATGLQIATDWIDLTKGTISNSLFVRGVLPSSVFWWSGSKTDGDLNTSNNCLGFTSATSALGTRGNANSTNGTWITNTPSPCNIVPAYVLCLGY